MVRATDPRQENGGLDLTIFIQKRKGTLTVSGKEMANVIAVAESSDTSSIKVHCLLSFLNTVQRTKREVTSLAYSGLFILQVMFSNLSAGVRLDLGKFDILANDFSKQFMGYTVSSRQFADRFKRIQESNQTVDERPSLSLSPVVSDVGFSRGIARSY